jgi:hypothetical protein
MKPSCPSHDIPNALAPDEDKSYAPHDVDGSTVEMGTRPLDVTHTCPVVEAPVQVRRSTRAPVVYPWSANANQDFCDD